MKNILILTILFLSIFVPEKLSATDYYLVAGLTDEPRFTSEWTTDPTGLTIVGQPSDFLGGHTWHIRNRANVLLTSGWTTMDANSVVLIGDGVSNTTLTIQGPLGAIGAPAVVDISAFGGLLISRNTAVPLRILNAASSVSFAATVSGNIPLVNYGNLIIQNQNTVGNKSGGTAVFGALTINNNFILNGRKIIIAGTLSGTGGFVGDLNGSEIEIASSAPVVGNLRFQASNRNLGALLIAHNLSSGIVTLASDLTIDNPGGGLMYLQKGVLDLNGFNLKISSNSELYFPASQSNGQVRGSATSALNIQASNISNSMVMAPTANILKSLTLNSNGRTLNVFGGLIISDSLSIQDGTFNPQNTCTITSTSSLKGRLGLTGGIIVGNITVQNFIPGTSSGWANLGTPGISGQTVASWDTYFSSGQTKGLPMTCQGCFYDVTGTGSYFESIQGWLEPSQTYDSTLSNASSLTPGKGFWVYVGSGLTTTTDLMLENTGLAVTGATTVPITKSSANGFNLIANPYPSPISWTKVMALTGNSTLIQNATYIWNADLSGGAGATTSFVGGTASPGGVTSANDIIPAGQGFYVQALSAGNLAFNESVKVSNNTSANPLLRSARSNVGDVFRVKLEGKEGDWDATVFRIHPMATPGFDGAWDARKIFGSPGYAGYPGNYTKYTTISSRDASGDDYSIHSFPEPSADRSIPLLVKVMQAGTYTISGLELENIPSCLILKDKLLNKTQDLQMGDYVFTISDTTSSPRFELTLCRGVAAPTAIKTNKIDAHSVAILKSENGILVNTSFPQNTPANIEVFNLLGQSLCDKVEINGLTNSTLLPVSSENSIVLVKISTATDSYSKKVLLR